MKIPKKVHHIYHSLFPMENISNAEETVSKVFLQQKSEVYKSINSNDTYPCVLRRILSKEFKNRIPNTPVSKSPIFFYELNKNLSKFSKIYQTQESLILLKKWKMFRHPNFVTLKDVFETSDFTKGTMNGFSILFLPKFDLI